MSAANLTTTRKTIYGLLGAALLGTSVLTASALAPLPVRADTAVAVIDPTRSFAPLVEKVMPSVVSVEVKLRAVSNEGGPDMQRMPDEFRQFFDQFPQFRDRLPNRPQQRGGGMAEGSGFVITPDGYVVTNNHVVDNASQVSLRFQNGDLYDADVVGTDPKTDLALLKIKNSDKSFPFVKFASAEAKVGDWVMAVGNPFGLGGTVTAGIVSARGRDIGSGPYDDFLQIDASINRGNSGGPAFNLDGQVVGINTAIFSPSGGSVGIGFAIPASTANDVIESLKANGAVTRGWLGVRIQGITPDLAEGLGLKEAKGAIISDVTEDSPALKAGLKQGDTILRANGQAIADARDLSRTIAKVKPGSEIPVDIIRNGKAETINVKIGVMPNDTPRMASKQDKQDDKLDLSALGLNVTPADDGAGVTITAIDPDSPAAERGLQPGDVILEVAGTQVTNPSEIQKILKGEKGKSVVMLVRSGDNQRYIALPREKS
ncbi:MAG: Do family serine endopeptidase [Proteobacteria bacterium]|nr:Do family serine endopeptidase [Pseudomonadota bacterium]